MTDPTLPSTSVHSGIPGQRSSSDHPMRPDLAPPSPDTPYVAPTRAATGESYGRWSLRVAAVLIDSLIQVPFLIVEAIGLVVAYDGGGLAWVERDGLGIWNDTVSVTVPQMTANTWAGLAVANLASLSLLVFSFWNAIVRQGRRGASIGKQCMNLMVVSETNGRPIGTLMTFIRHWAHLLDLLTLGIGYLWPLWDRKRQTFADMAMRTAVLHLPPLPSRARVPAQPAGPYGW